MPFSSTGASFFGRFGPSQNAPEFSGLGNAYNKISATATPNLFQTIQSVRQNELERQTKQAAIAKALMDIQQSPLEQQYKQAQIKKALYDIDPNSVENQLRQAQIQGISDKSEYQSGLLDEKQRNIDRLIAQQGLIEKLMGGQGADNLPPGTIARVGGVTIPLNRKYTVEESQAVSGAESLIPKIEQLKSLVGTPAELQAALPFGGGSTEGQRFKSLKDDISQQLLYFRSGKAINEDEYQRFKKLLPQIFRNKEVDIEQLNRFINDFQPIADRIKFGGSYDTNKSSPTTSSGIPSVGGDFNGEKVLKVTKVS